MMRPCALGGRVEFGVPGILLTAKREESGNGDRLHEKLQWRHIVFMRYNTSKKAYSGVLLMKGLWQWLASCKTVSGDKVYVFRWDNWLHHLVCKNTHEVGAGWCRTINPAITSTCSNLLVTPCFCSLKISHMSNFHGKFYMNPDWNVYPQSSPGSITFFFYFCYKPWHPSYLYLLWLARVATYGVRDPQEDTSLLNAALHDVLVRSAWPWLPSQTLTKRNI